MSIILAWLILDPGGGGKGAMRLGVEVVLDLTPDLELFLLVRLLNSSSSSI